VASSDLITDRLHVTVVSQSGRRELSLPPDSRVRDLLPGIVRLCEDRHDGAQWSLKPRGEDVLAGDQTLADAGVLRGAILELIEPVATAPEGETSVSKPERGPRIDSLSESAYIRVLEDAITGREISQSMVVAVMANHAGDGTTTIAALLATLLGSLRDDSIALVDANPDSGALGHWLAPDALRPTFERELDPHQVLAALVGVGIRTSVLPAPSGPVEWRSLIEHLRRLQSIVVLDCAAGFRKPSSAAALAAADLVVVVTRAAHRSPRMPHAKTIVQVENQAPRQQRSMQSASGVRVVTVVDEPTAARRLKTRGFTWSQAPESWQVSIRELAALLIGSAS
jgi:Mrp family chromosome partitioning ATPase